MASELDRAVKEFNSKVNAFAKNVVPFRLLTFYRRLSLELLRNVVYLTPVDTGRARGNWQLTTGSPAAGEREDWKGREPVTEGASTLAGMKGLNVVWISNNVPYIGRLESGSSTQAPSGMVAVSMSAIGKAFGD